MERDLDWDGCCNVRDLGGLPTASGAVTSWGRIVRSDNPARLSAQGWQQLLDHGMRTVVALRTIGAEDVEPDPGCVPPMVTIERVHLEDATDAEFRRRCVETGWWATPLQWAAMLEFWPERCASAVSAVAQAQPGGVVVSCGIGRDRTGLVTFMLLALAGVSAAVIAEDWSRSTQRLVSDPQAQAMAAQEILDREGMSALEAVGMALDLDVEARLSGAGLKAAEVAAVRGRLLS